MGVISQDVRSGSKPDRNLAMELVRVTEAAALASARWVGRGDKEAADGAAVDAMRLLLDTVPMDGLVVIGEGEKDEAPMLYNGERIGDGSPPEVDIAVDPLEGTRLCALGMPSALAVIAMAERGTMFDPGPCFYMEKLAGGPEIADLLTLDEPLVDVIAKIGERKGTGPGGVTVMVLDRPRHEEQIAGGPRGRRPDPADHRRRRLGVAVRGLGDRRRRSALGHRRHARGSDLGRSDQVPRRRILGRLWPRDDDERQAPIDAGYDLDEVLDADRLVNGNDVFFAATGVTDGELLQGVRYPRGGKATTESLIMRSRSGTVRTVQATPRPGEAARGRRRALRLSRRLPATPSRIA